jgi:hypothetical protein
MAVAGRIGAAGLALERESRSLRDRWDAMHSLASGDVLDRLTGDVVMPYVVALSSAAREVEGIAAMARQAEALLAA